MAIGERGCVSRFLRSHIDRSRTTADLSDKAGGWLDHSRCADSHEDRAFIQNAEDAIQLERHFAEPADMWANPTAAFAPGNFHGRIVGARVVKWRSGASIAAAFEKLAVHVNQLSGAGMLVQAIHILRAKKQPVPEVFLKARQREVPGI